MEPMLGLLTEIDDYINASMIRVLTPPGPWPILSHTVAYSVIVREMYHNI